MATRSVYIIHRSGSSSRPQKTVSDRLCRGEWGLGNKPEHTSESNPPPKSVEETGPHAIPSRTGKLLHGGELSASTVPSESVQSVDFSKENLQDRTREERLDNIPRKKPYVRVRADNSPDRQQLQATVRQARRPSRD